MRARPNLMAMPCGVALLAAVCRSPDGGPRDETNWAGSISTEGNVTTVINESGSVWGGPATLVEESSIGALEGDDPERRLSSMQRFNADGRVGDLLEPPTFDYQPVRVVAQVAGRNGARFPPQYPNVHWTLDAAGRMIAGLATEYRFEIREPGGTATVIEKYWDPVAVPAPSELSPYLVPHINGEVFVGVVQDENETEFVKRYRLLLPDRDPRGDPADGPASP